MPRLRILLPWLLFVLAALLPKLGQAQIYQISNVTTIGSEILTCTVNGTVIGRNRMVGGVTTGFVGSGAGVVLVPGGNPAPPVGTRGNLTADWFLDSGLINPSTAADAMTITFPQPIVNRSGPDIVILEITTTNTGGVIVGDPCVVTINGVPVTVAAANWGNTGYGIVSADQYNTRNSSNTADVTATTFAQLDSAPLSLINSDISQTVVGVGLDLSQFNVPLGASITSLTIASSTTSFVDPVLVAGIIVPPEQTNQPVIEEIMASNVDTLQDEDLDYPDWIEIYNGTGTDVNLKDWTLSDDPVFPAKWKFPDLPLTSYSYTYVFCSGKNKFTGAHPHTNFKLQKTGATVLLSQPNGSVASTITYPAQVEGVTYGALGAAQSLGYLETPTPGLPNSGRQATSAPLDEIVFSRPSGVVTGTTSLTMSLPATAPSGSLIRYRLDGGIPTESSTLYTGPLTLTAGTTVSARIFRSGYLPSKIGRRSFIQLGSDLASNYNSTSQPFSSNLPIVVLDSFGINVDGTTDPIGVRPDKFTQAAVYDLNPATGRASLGTVPTVVSRAGTHVRGQSSSGFSQRPYSLEFWKETSDDGQDVSLFGFPADADWVLQTLWTDKTFMRNYLMQNTMFETNGANAGRRCRLVEVFFNQGDGVCNYSDYRGVYLLIEKIRRSQDRIDISKINSEMTSPTLISGGYIFKKDKTPYDAPFSPPSVSGSSWNGLTYDIYDPSPTAAQTAWLRNYINQTDIAIYQSDFANPASANYYGKWLDWRSFIDKQIWQETCKEVDSYIYSYYYSKERGQPLRAFPFWDVDRSLGNANYGTADNAFGARWWTAGSGYAYLPRLFVDPEFTQAYWDRWWKLRRGVFDTTNFLNRIESTALLLTDNANPTLVTNTAAPALQNPAARHFKRWPTLATNSYGSGPPGQVDRNTYRKELDLMKSWFTYRMDWFETQSPSRPPDLLNASTRLPQFGGSVSPGYEALLVNPNQTGGTVYYTINGSDPRQTGGTVASGVSTANPGTITFTQLLPSSSVWKYIAPSSAEPAPQGAATWKDAAYDDSTWTSGTAPLGYGETGLGTDISPTPPSQTTSTVPAPVYFRKTFTVSNAASYTGLNLELMADDGAVVYLNGIEVARSGMPYPPTPITFATQASGPLDDSRGEPAYNLIRLSPSLLIEGTNTIAVEVHQALYTTSTPTADLRFDLRLRSLVAGINGTPIALNSSGTFTLRSRVYFGGTTWSPLTEATFVTNTVPATSSNIAITEVMYAPAAPTAAEAALGYVSRDFEYIELTNVGNAFVDLAGAQFTDGVVYTFPTNNPGATVLAAGARLVLAANPGAFANRYGSNPAVRVLGPYTGNLSNDGENVLLVSATGAVMAQFTYSPRDPWPLASGSGYSLVLNNPGPSPAYNSGVSWRQSAAIGGTPGLANSLPFTGSAAGDTDGDGLSDFLEYATGSSMSDPSSKAVPDVSIATFPGLEGQYLSVVYRRNLLADGVNYSVELSSDLKNWSSDSATITYVSSLMNSDGTTSVTYRSTLPVSAGQLLFARLRVSP